MEFKGTKGEWKFKLDEIHESDYYPSFELDFDFGESSENNLTLWCHSFGLSEEELANAKLIASAPDLLEALQDVVSHVRLDLLPRTTANKITQAIEKALK